jgi:hypothetical protein
VPSTVPAQNAINPSRLAAVLSQLNPSLRDNRPEKPKPRIMDQLNRAFKPGETITARQAALLAEAVGLPGRTYAQIAKGESSLQPGAVGHDPGGTVGLGLWQMTPGVQSPETRKKWDAIAKRYPGGYSNPVANAKMAAVIAGGGTGVSNYYGTGFVTNPDAHVRGGPQRAQRVLGMSPGEASGATRAGQRRLSTSELFYDPGISLVDNQPTPAIGGHSDHVHFGSTDPRSLLQAALVAQRHGADVSENPAFGGVDPVHTGTTSASGGPQGLPTGDSMHYQYQRIPRGLMDSRLYRKSGAQGRLIGDAIDINGADSGTLSAVDQALARRSGAPVGAASSLGGALGGAAGGGGAAGLLSAVTSATGGAVSSPRQVNTLARLFGTGGSSSPVGSRPPATSPLSAVKPSPGVDLSPRTAGRRQSEQDQQQQDPGLQALIQLLYG